MTLEVEVSKGDGPMYEITDIKIAASEMDQAIADPAKWTNAILNNIDVEKRTANFKHQALKNIGMMAMTMDFTIAPSIDLSTLTAGSEVQIIVEMPSEGVFEVTHIRPKPVE
ncbi:MAG: copper-binding protein [Emcibacteraceae bacterium]|nr:copper-binding protein [Emcibacteraceae bacterium]